MALEEFFTLTELKNGLTSPDKVNDLITAMQKDQDSIVNNFGEATQQWSTVARTIAATEDHNCLDLFINLNGLSFIDKYLNNVQNLKNDTNDTFLEDKIIELLKALDRLQIDNQKSLDSGIGKTVKNLVDHGSSLISEKAKLLCDKWMINRDNDTVPQDVENSEITTPDKVIDKVPANQEPTHGEVNCQDKIEVSGPLEQIASSADVDNVLESSVKSDVRGDKDEEMVDNGDDFQSTLSLETQKVEISKTSSNSGSERDDEDTKNGSCLFKLSMSKKTSDMELDYGMIDPLEVARQVANEVEKEVDDSRDRSCSTSETPKTPESTIPEETPPVTCLKEPVKESETLVSKPDVTASQVSEVAQESEPNTGKGIGGFDLNQEVCSEEVDINPVSVSVSSTVSVVSASRATAVCQLPITPLQFEGTLGWKGSASTSAFRRVPESEKTGSHKRLDIDLNVVEGVAPDPGVPSGEESSVEAGPTRPERPQLDLNSISDEAADVARPDWWQSPSRSSSSSSKQPSRNIDLNLTDQPQESVVSIFGAEVGVKNKDFRTLPEPSGRSTNPTANFNVGRTHYNNQLFYGYPPGPAMFLATSGGPIPYMVDSRGAPVVPQIMGSSSTQPSFMVNMAAAGGPTGAPPLHNFDLNTGLSMVGGKRREPDGRWDFFPANKHQQPPWR